MTDPFAMTASEIERILVAVPIGEANAKGWRWVWELLDEGAPVTIRNKLAIIADQGRINRRPVATNSGTTWVYWRDLPPAERAA